jgi:hypothetical protein
MFLAGSAAGFYGAVSLCKLNISVPLFLIPGRTVENRREPCSRLCFDPASKTPVAFSFSSAYCCRWKKLCPL